MNYTDPVSELTPEQLARLRDEMQAHSAEQQLHIEYEEEDCASDRTED